MSQQNSSSCNGQLNSGSLHKQTRRNSLSGDVCSPVEDHDMVPSFSHNIESQTHSRLSQCDGRPSVQVQPSSVERMVTTSTGLQADPSIRVSYPRPKGLGYRCSKHKLDGSHCLCLPSNGSPSQGDPKNQAMPLPDHTNSPRLARDALVLGPSTALTEIPLQLPVSTTLLKQSHSYVFHSNPQHLNLHAWCLGVDNSKNKASLWRWHRELLPLSGHQQVYKSKWALFEKWCRENSVDFSTPSVK